MPIVCYAPEQDIFVGFGFTQCEKEPFYPFILLNLHDIYRQLNLLDPLAAEQLFHNTCCTLFDGLLGSDSKLMGRCSGGTLWGCYICMLCFGQKEMYAASLEVIPR
jgi:hypothetical protein